MSAINPRSTSFDLSKSMVAAGVDIAPSTVRYRLFDQWRKARRPYKKQLLTPRMKKKRFRDGRDSLEDDPRPGHSVTVRNDENIEKVAEILRNDRYVSTRLIEEVTGIPKSTVHLILTENLGKRKVFARFVPHTLTNDQKHCRVEHYRDMQQAATRDPNFMVNIVTGDETWCFKYEPLTKRQSAEWKSPEDAKPKKVRMEKSRIKTLLTVFFDSKGIIHKEFMPEGESVNAAYYLSVLKRLWARIHRVRPEYQNQASWFLLHDNASTHKSLMVRNFLAKKSFVLLNQPPYFPDLAPADFWLLPKLKLAMKGKHIATVSDIQAATTATLRAIPKDGLEECFNKFHDRFQHCIDSKGVYFE
ncbi:histone-lysine N-methyltransferase SETMAR-like [Uloborus diversus]|uniref:histone-lysine N-methyltransferase SETMAR-like n=1 Tax=Uloborus diversus TaxID=327109 RepID=UPI00240A54E4|nr:histone-lysine N-methyltransferase SETMAR-like [Uloborus diversus]